METNARIREITCRLDAIVLFARQDHLDVSTPERLAAIAGVASWARLHAAVLAEHSEAA